MSNITEMPTVASIWYVKFVNEYRQFAKECAASIVKLAETLVKARSLLDYYEFESFCKEVGLNKDSSTFRKLLVIGQKASRFEPFYEKLPNSWTTIYKLAQIGNRQFDQVTKSERFSPFMTAKDVAEILAPLPENKPYELPEPSVITLELTRFDEQKMLELYDEIFALQRRFRFYTELSGDIETLVDAKRGSWFEQISASNQLAKPDQ